jgi:hypothetical protein
MTDTDAATSTHGMHTVSSLILTLHLPGGDPEMDFSEHNAMGDDEYHPLEQSGSNLTEAGGIGYMIVDVIDSLQIMGLQDECSRARTWVSEKLSFERDGDFSTFEVCLARNRYIHI